ncbi:hypothetical protein E2C01_055626 [Portunus trituberculatus]|uniref:Uncharacterized protein n=1 Tax=Portunus trituberculatus TaxID=210409 RepID=A0A5B7GVA9_PORTR|nr:hypothetical protein [Portunus trituberculatus]
MRARRVTTSQARADGADQMTLCSLPMLALFTTDLPPLRAAHSVDIMCCSVYSNSSKHAENYQANGLIMMSNNSLKEGVSRRRERQARRNLRMKRFESCSPCIKMATQVPFMLMTSAAWSQFSMEPTIWTFKSSGSDADTSDSTDRRNPAPPAPTIHSAIRVTPHTFQQSPRILLRRNA